MDIRVNGEPLALDLKADSSVGDALAAADELLETAGAIIVGLKVDGEDLAAEAFPSIKDRPFSGPGSIDIAAESMAATKAKALSTLLELLSLSGEAAAAPASGDWPALAQGLGELAEAFSGLFSADELSFVKGYADLAAKARAASGKAGGNGQGLPADLRSELSRQAENLLILFKERLEEIEHPGEEFRRTAALYRSHAVELGELPVLLQTGKDERAMKAVLLFIEIFNKVIRLVPELEREGLDTRTARVGGQSIPEFYNAFNDILRRLSKAFEDRDTVLIGDLAEYEVVPRMGEFFTTMEEALARP